LPSLWPETWCYTLTQAWQAGLNVLAFNLGTPAARVRRTGRGWLVPLRMTPQALNNWMLATSFSVVRRSPSAGLWRAPPLARQDHASPQPAL
jgi:hypothetical protein